MTHHSGVITIATTNDASLVDRAARRAARFDQVVEFRLPDVAQRHEILSLYLAKVRHSADVAVLAAESDGFSGADLREVVRAAVLDADDVNDITHDEVRHALADRARHLEKPGRTGFAA